MLFCAQFKQKQRKKLMDYVLSLNCGSSSLKYKLFDADTKQVVLSGLAEKIKLPDSFITQKWPDGKKIERQIVMRDHGEALNEVMNMLREASIDTNQIKGVGHRVVLGGDNLTSSCKITDDVIREIQKYADIAPLHNPPALAGINTALQVMPNAVQVAVFDNAFHQTVPEHVFRYAVPDAWYSQLKVRKYGYHGTSHLYVSKRAAALLGKDASECNLITVHLGSGASVAAIKNGKCYDTSMGFTPITGLVMGTRPGNVDASAVLYVMKKLGLTVDQAMTHLNKESGMLGLCKFSDLRDVEENLQDNPKCKLALDKTVLSVRQTIGAYIATLDGRVDAIVFTAGGGENDTYIRERCLENLEPMGIFLDKTKNATIVGRKGVSEAEISTPNSPIKVFMIATNEELVLLEDTLAIMNGTYNPDHLKMNYSFAQRKQR